MRHWDMLCIWRPSYFPSGAFSKLFTDKSYKHNRRFNLGEFLIGQKGFNRLQTEESDHELDHLNSDSEVEEYSATSELKA